QAFRDNDIDAEVLSRLSADDLVAIGVSSVGHRRRLLDAIMVLSGEPTPARASVLEPAPEPVPQRAPEAERRQLTAMFCDLVGSTSISERLDPEELRDILALYYERCTEVIDRFGGHISRYVGDGIDVYFGYPQAFEDSVKRAAYSGLHILRAI